MIQIYLQRVYDYFHRHYGYEVCTSTQEARQPERLSPSSFLVPIQFNGKRVGVLEIHSPDFLSFQKVSKMMKEIDLLLGAGWLARQENESLRLLGDRLQTQEDEDVSNIVPFPRKNNEDYLLADKPPIHPSMAVLKSHFFIDANLSIEAHKLAVEVHDIFGQDLFLSIDDMGFNLSSDEFLEFKSLTLFIPQLEKLPAQTAKELCIALHKKNFAKERSIVVVAGTQMSQDHFTRGDKSLRRLVKKLSQNYLRINKPLNQEERVTLIQSTLCRNHSGLVDGKNLWGSSTE